MRDRQGALPPILAAAQPAVMMISSRPQTQELPAAKSFSDCLSCSGHQRVNSLSCLASCAEQYFCLLLLLLLLAGVVTMLCSPPAEVWGFLEVAGG